MKPCPGERELLRSSGRLGLRRGGSEMSRLGLGFRGSFGFGVLVWDQGFGVDFRLQVLGVQAV